LAGGVYDVLEHPLTLLPKGGGWTFIYTGNLNVQTLLESLNVALLYSIGVIGLYMLMRSTRLVYKPRQGYLLLILGLAISFIAVYYCTTLLQEKVGITGS